MACFPDCLIPSCLRKPIAKRAAPCADGAPTFAQVAELAIDTQSRLVSLELTLNRVEQGVVAARQTIDDMKRKVRGKPPLGLGLEIAPPPALPAMLAMLPRVGTSRAHMRRLLPVEEEEARRASLESQRSSRDSGKNSGTSGNFSLDDSTEDGVDGLQSIAEEAHGQTESGRSAGSGCHFGHPKKS